MQVRVQLHQDCLGDLLGHKIDLGLALNGLIVGMQEHFDIVVGRAKWKRMRRLAPRGGRGEQTYRENGRDSMEFGQEKGLFRRKRSPFPI